MAVMEDKSIESVRNTKLKAWGTSQGVRIPKQVCAWAGMRYDTDLSMETGSDSRGRFIILRPLGDGHRHYGRGISATAMDSLFDGYAGEYEPRELDWGGDIGAEVVE